MGQDRRLDADAVVADRHDRVDARSNLGIPFSAGFIDNNVGCLDCNAAAFGEGVSRIDDQIENCRLELGTIHPARVERRIELQLDFNRRTGGMAHQGFEF